MTCRSEFWPKLLYDVVNKKLLIKFTRSTVAHIFMIREKFTPFHRSVTGELLKPFRT